MCPQFPQMGLNGVRRSRARLSSTSLLPSRCRKKVPASKRFTIHRASNVLTLSLKRFANFSGGKITKVRSVAARTSTMRGRGQESAQACTPALTRAHEKAGAGSNGRLGPSWAYHAHSRGQGLGVEQCQRPFGHPGSPPCAPVLHSDPPCSLPGLSVEGLCCLDLGRYMCQLEALLLVQMCVSWGWAGWWDP